jgi:hypothetical protein
MIHQLREDGATGIHPAIMPCHQPGQATKRAKKFKSKKTETAPNSLGGNQLPLDQKSITGQQ